MLKQPDTFLPITTPSGYQAQVSAGLNGDFLVVDVKTGERFFNSFKEGQFRRVAEYRYPFCPDTLAERVEDRTLLKNLIQAKNAYVDRYFEH
jgi:hypothetical protein